MLDNVFSVNIIQSDGNVVIIEEVVAVRIVDRYYNLLIMKDYMPVIGEVRGSVVVMGKNARYAMRNGVAYFINNDNKFTLIIKEDQGRKSGFLPESGLSEQVYGA